MRSPAGCRNKVFSTVVRRTYTHGHTTILYRSYCHEDNLLWRFNYFCCCCCCWYKRTGTRHKSVQRNIYCTARALPAVAVSSACPGRHALDRKRGLVLLCRPPARRPDGGTLRVLLRQTIVPSEIKSAPVSCSRRPLKNNVNNTEKKKKKHRAFLEKGIYGRRSYDIILFDAPFRGFLYFLEGFEQTAAAGPHIATDAFLSERDAFFFFFPTPWNLITVLCNRSILVYNRINAAELSGRTVHTYTIIFNNVLSKLSLRGRTPATVDIYDNYSVRVDLASGAMYTTLRLFRLID